MLQVLVSMTGNDRFCADWQTMFPQDAVNAPANARSDPKRTPSDSEIGRTCGANRTTIPTIPRAAPTSTRPDARVPKIRRDSTILIQSIVENAIAASADVM